MAFFSFFLEEHAKFRYLRKNHVRIAVFLTKTATPLFKTTKYVFLKYPALNRVTPSKAKNCTQIFTNTYLATSANHKSDYTASFCVRNTSKSFTASTYARISRISRIAKITKNSAIARIIYIQFHALFIHVA